LDHHFEEQISRLLGVEQLCINNMEQQILNADPLQNIEYQDVNSVDNLKKDQSEHWKAINNFDNTPVPWFMKRVLVLICLNSAILFKPSVT